MNEEILQLADETADGFSKRFIESLKSRLGIKQFDESDWSGVASSWSSTEAYSKSCLIDVNPSGEEKKQSHCMLPLTKEGSDKPNIYALQTMATVQGIDAIKKPDGVSANVWAGAKMRAAKRIATLWSKAFDSEIPESVRSLISKDFSFIDFKESKDGSLRMLGIYSNKFKDEENEIIPEAAHKDYISWLKETGFKPVVTVFHQPQIRYDYWLKLFEKFGDNEGNKLNEAVRKIYKDFAIADVERVMFVNGFTVISAVVRPEKMDIVNKLKEKGILGMSHGFILSERRDNILTNYKSFEVSLLPLKRAANIFTMSAFQKEITDMAEKLLPEDVEFIKEIYGDNLAGTLEDSTRAMKDVLESTTDFKTKTEEETVVKQAPDEGAEAEDTEEKEVEEVKVVPEEGADEKASDEDKPDDPYVEFRSRVIEDLKIPELVEVIKAQAVAITEQGEQIEGLQTMVEVLGAGVTKANRTLDEAVAEKFESPNWNLVGYSASKSDDNLLDKEDKEDLAKNGPDATIKASPETDFMSAMTSAFAPGSLS